MDGNKVTPVTVTYPRVGCSTYRVLRKQLNPNPVIFEPFHIGQFIDLCNRQ